MTDARFPERWLNDRRITRLSGDAFKLFMFGITWSVANRTEGVIAVDDLDDIPRVQRGSVVELEKAGLWLREGDRWLIVDHRATQTSNAELERDEANRERDRIRKARQRAEAKTVSTGTSTGTSTRTSARTMQDRTGQASDRTGTEAGHEEDPWPETAKPGSTIPYTAGDQP